MTDVIIVVDNTCEMTHEMTHEMTNENDRVL